MEDDIKEEGKVGEGLEVRLSEKSQMKLISVSTANINILERISD